MHSELQQLGLPREHSTSIKRVVDENANDLTAKFKAASLRGSENAASAGRLNGICFSVNALESVTASVDEEMGWVTLEVMVDGVKEVATLTPFTVEVLLQEVKRARNVMQQLAQ